MNNKTKASDQKMLAVGRQFTHLVRSSGSVEAGMDALKKVANTEYKTYIERIEAALSNRTHQSHQNLGPYATLMELVALVKKEGGNQIAVFSGFDDMLRAVDAQLLNFWENIKSFVLYMVSVLVVAGIVAATITIFVIPQFQMMFEEFNVNLPALTGWLLGNSSGVFGAIMLGFALMMAGYVFFMLQIKSASANLRSLNPALRYVPMFRHFADCYSRFMSINFSLLLLSAELPAQRVLKLSSQLCNDQAMLDFENARSKLDRMENSMLSNIAFAREAGNLGAELEYCVNEQAYKLAGALNILRHNSLLFFHVLLALFIGLFVIAMYLPIFKMGEVS